MKAMILEQAGMPLREADVPVPAPGPRQVLVRVLACGVCRTDLHVVDGDLPDPKPQVVPGHEIVGEVTALGSDAGGFILGERVGIPWLGRTCGACDYCAEDRENLCDEPGFTGYQIDGGYAEYAVAGADFCFPLSQFHDPVATAPLLCAGLIGYRAWRMAGEARRLGIYGFGAAAHILAQVARQRHRDVHAFTLPGDLMAQDFARALGAVWSGGSDQAPPEPLDAAIIFAPVGDLVPAALQAVRKGGAVICAGIHMSDIPAFPYRLLWQERIVRSVANLTRDDARAFLKLAGEIEIRTETHSYPLEQANRALDDLRGGRFNGAAVLVP